MNQDTVKIILAVIFVAAMFVYINVRKEAVLPEVNDEVIVETADTPENVVDNEPGGSPVSPVTTDPESAVEPEVLRIPSFLDSFDEDTLIGESDDVQAGIDLLNNPLQ